MASLKRLRKELNSGPCDDAFDQIAAAIQNLPEEEQSSPDSFEYPKELQGSGHLALFSDGACRGNPGPGAWGFVAQTADSKILCEGSGYKAETTNNQMELAGAIEGINEVMRVSGMPARMLTVTLYTDSKYVVDGLNSWVDGWKRRGWKKADNKAPENLELWQNLDQLKSTLGNLNLKWVKGHAGHPQNEYCDKLANQVLDENGH